MQRFRKRPVTIRAYRWLGHVEGPEDPVVRYWRRPDVDGTTPCPVCDLVMHIHGWIDTLEGGHRVCPGDWIIEGVIGEFYPCKPDVFEQTYEPLTY